MEQETPILTVTRGKADILQKVGDMMLTTRETLDYTRWSRTYLAEHPEIPRTSAPVRFRLSDIDRVLDARTLNPLPKRGAA